MSKQIPMTSTRPPVDLDEYRASRARHASRDAQVGPDWSPARIPTRVYVVVGVLCAFAVVLGLLIPAAGIYQR